MASAPSHRTAGRNRERGLEGLLAGRSLTHQRWGLERVEGVLEAVGRPERGLVALHVGGTNGKGSAAAMAASVLAAMGREVGLYTSPHLVDVSERIVWRGQPAPRDLVDACADRVREAADRVDATYFEALTAVAFLAFAELDAERVVVEVGMGGRLDATNVLHPVACAITGVSLDHIRELGRTVRAIAEEKAGILKPGVPAVLGALTPGVRRLLEERARQVGSPLYRVGREARVEEIRVDVDGTSFTYRSCSRGEAWSLRLPLPGAHQAGNAAVALLLLEASGEPPEEAQARAGLSRLRWPGRFQVLHRPDGTWVLDGAHNPAGMVALATTLGSVQTPAPRVLLISILKDKPWRAMLGSLPTGLSAAMLTVAPSAPPDRRWDLRQAGTALPTAFRELEPDFDRALVRARELAGNGTVVVAGSLTAVGDALARLQ